MFARAGCDAAVTGPGVSVGNAHTANEWNRETDLEAAIELYNRSTLGERRPVDRPDIFEGMLKHANLTITAWHGERLVGISRSLTDWSYVAYLADLAVDAEYPLEAGLTIGRGRSNGIALSDQFVSFMHARIFPDGQFFFIEDLGSTNGTFVNGRKIDGPTQLKVRDEVVFGDTTLRYEE